MNATKNSQETHRLLGRFCNWFPPSQLVLAAIVWLVALADLDAQPFSVLHSFSTVSGSLATNYDGAYPHDGISLYGNTIYGTAPSGGASGYGTVFKLNTNGTGFTNLYSFTRQGDGAHPYAGVIASNDLLFGTATGDGASGQSGAVFSLGTNGDFFRLVYSFSADGALATNFDGAFPAAGLILFDNIMYGAAETGGTAGFGTVFAVNTDGTGFTNLHNFTNGEDGAVPFATLILSRDTLYGTTFQGGAHGGGTIYSLTTNGSHFTTIYSFSGDTNGGFPEAALVMSEGRLFGTTYSGGTDGYGVVFAINADGTGFTNLHSFKFPNGPVGTNSDGASPNSSLILYRNTLFGTTSAGGSFGDGTLFSVHTDGTKFTTVFPFNEGNAHAGGRSHHGLVLSTNNLSLYGTAAGGGANGTGTVFSLTLLPQLTIVKSGTNLVLSWTGSEFSLESSTNLAASSWSTVSQQATAINGQNVVTIPITVDEQFYRLMGEF